jgi:hypothetical protein
MPTTDIDALATVLEQSGVGLLLNQDRLGRLNQIAQEVHEASQEIASRIGSPGFDLLGEMQHDTSALKPLIQLFASPTSKEMRAMVYCVLRGMEIKTIDFSYRFKSAVSLSVKLEHNVTGEPLVFLSDVVWDAEILRHIGIMTMGQRPVLHGFYAFR